MNPITRRRQFAPRLYLLNDGFHDILAAGAVNGTYSTPPHNVRVLGDGKRTVVDTENKLSISGGKLVFAGGKAAPAWGDPGIWYPAEARVAGKVLLFSVRNNDTGYARYGFSTAVSVDPVGALVQGCSADSGLLQYDDVYGPSIASFLGSTSYEIAIVLRAAGMYVFQRVVGSAWTFVGIGNKNTTTPIYPCVVSYNSAVVADEPRIAKRRWLPEPIAYDAFTRGDGPLGVTDLVGPDGQSCISRTWSFPAGTAAISGNAAVISPTAGAEALTDPDLEAAYVGGKCGTLTASFAPTLVESADSHAGAKAQQFTAVATSCEIYWPTVIPTVGTWYSFSVWGKRTAGANGNVKIRTWQDDATVGGAIASAAYAQYVLTLRSPSVNVIYPTIFETGAVTFDTVIVDDASLKPLTLASLFSSVTDAKTSDVMVDVKVAALTTGTQAGLVARLDDATTPANFIIAYFDGAGNAKCDECVAGVYAALISAASVYAANATLRLDVSGTAVRLYTITSAGVAVLVGTATTNVVTGTSAGIFSTYNLNTFASFQLFPKGTSNELAALDSL
jgi:hypothetical protein